MALRLFLTGGSGFVGARLIPVLLAGGHRVVALDRSGTVRARQPVDDALTFVQADLLHADAYREALASTDVVVHLAAATGRASEADHFRINAEGTEELLDQCRRSGVRRFLFVSSVAVTFDDLRDYHYARAKLRAEASVRASGLDYAILRPTMILGPGSPIQQSLGALASLPIMPVFGTGRTPVQPVHVTDVVADLVQIVEEDRFRNETIPCGGPETLTIEALMQRLRLARGGSSGRVMHLPLGLLVPPLRLAETLGLGRVLPLSAGQLSSFRSDGTAAPGPLRDDPGRELVSLAAMVDAAPVASASSRTGLDRECQVFTRYLARTAPSAQVTATYHNAHTKLESLTPRRRFDAVLVRIAGLHPVGTKVADAYARILAPGSSLRRKLVLLLAVLETSSPTYRAIDAPPAASTAGLVGKMAWMAGGAVISLLLGTVVLAPVHLVLSVLDRKVP